MIVAAARRLRGPNSSPAILRQRGGGAGPSSFGLPRRRLDRNRPARHRAPKPNANAEILPSEGKRMPANRVVSTALALLMAATAGGCVSLLTGGRSSALSGTEKRAYRQGV